MSPYVRPPAIGPGDRRAAWSVFLILLSVYTATFVGLPDNPDAEVEFQTARSLARDASLALGDTPEAQAIIENHFNVVPGGPGREGRFYSWHGVGQALVAVPFYLGGSLLARALPAYESRHAATRHRGYPRSEYFAHLAVGWRNPLLGAWTAMLVVLTARRLKAKRSVAWLTGLSYGLCTFAWPQARSTLSDVQATFFTFLAVHQLVILREAFLGLRSPRLGPIALLGLAIGASVLTRVALAPVALVLCLATALVITFGRRSLEERAHLSNIQIRPFMGFWFAAFSLPLIACASLFLYTNQVRFGSPLESGYGVVMREGTFFSYPPLLGLASLLVAPGKGLLWMAPGLLLFPVGFVLARRKRHTVWPWTALIVAVACVAPIVFMQSWHGAYTYGPRYVLPLVPVAWLAIGYVLESRQPLRVGVTHVLFLLGFAVQVPAALVDHRTHLELAVHAARIRWPDVPANSPREADEARFLAIQWDWGFAAPWAHWRILRHRVAGLGEDFPVRGIFLMDSPAVLTPGEPRERGFQHLAWIDFEQRLGGRSGPAWTLVVALFGVGILTASQSLDRRGFEARSAPG